MLDADTGQILTTVVRIWQTRPATALGLLRDHFGLTEPEVIHLARVIMNEQRETFNRLI